MVAELAHERVDVARHRLLVVTGLRLVGTAHAADVDDEQAKGPRQGRHDLAKPPPGLGMPRQQHKRRSFAADDIVQPHAVHRREGVLEAGQAANERFVGRVDLSCVLLRLRSTSSGRHDERTRQNQRERRHAG